MMITIGKGSKGFSILEVLIAITISLILMLGILQLFISNKNTYRMEDSYADLQDNNRFLHHYLSNVIRTAAYRSPQQNSFFQPIDSLFTGANLFIQATNNNGTNGSDTLTIRYQGSGNGAGTPDGTVRDCLNRPIDSFVTATNIFSISANNELICQAQNPSAAPVASRQVLLRDIENMQVLLGEDLNGDKSPNRYVNPGHPSLDFNNVVSIRVSLLLRSSEPTSPTPDNESYNLLGTLHNAGGDNFIRQVLTFTITLRNTVTDIIL